MPLPVLFVTKQKVVVYHLDSRAAFSHLQGMNWSNVSNLSVPLFTYLNYGVISAPTV